MCGPPSCPGQPELESFVAALREIFHGESWEDIEACAERAWRACGLGEDAVWADVEARVRSAWTRMR